MKRTRSDWKELYDGEYHTIYETQKNKKGNRDYVLYHRGIYEYFTPSEFSELIDGFREVSDKMFKPKGDCYK